MRRQVSGMGGGDALPWKQRRPEGPRRGVRGPLQAVVGSYRPAPGPGASTRVLRGKAVKIGKHRAALPLRVSKRGGPAPGWARRQWAQRGVPLQPRDSR